MVEGILVEGLVYGLMALGVFITFRILDFPDLTVDGSFPLGAAIMAAMITAGANVMLALALAFLGGLAAGVVTAIIHNRLKVPHLLAGILTMTMLYSINIRVLSNRANVPLIRQDTILTWVRGLGEQSIGYEWSLTIFFGVVTIAVLVLLDVFFRTDLGMTLGAMGDNQQMVVTAGADPALLKIIGVSLSNGIVAVSGAFAAQYLGFADVNLGQGIIISGLASVMIGEFLLRSNRIWLLTLRVVLGSILFRGIMFAGRFYGYYINLTPNDLRLITGLLIILSLAITQLRGRRRKGTSLFRNRPRPAGSSGLPADAAQDPTDGPRDTGRLARMGERE
jgi:putative ABC transport system permease protein